MPPPPKKPNPRLENALTQKQLRAERDQLKTAKDLSRENKKIKDLKESLAALDIDANKHLRAQLKLQKELSKAETAALSLLDKVIEKQEKELKLKKLEYEASEQIWKKGSAYLEHFNKRMKDNRFKDLTDQLKELKTTAADSNFGKGIKYFYKDVSAAASQYLELQGRFQTSAKSAGMGLATTPVSMMTKALNAVGLVSDKAANQVGGVTNRIAELQAGFRKLSGEAGKTAAKLGASVSEVEELQIDLARTFVLDVSTDKAVKAVASVAESITYLSKANILSVDESKQAFFELSQQIGTSTAGEIDQVAESFRVLAGMPDIMHARLSKVGKEIGRFSIVNRRDFMQQVLQINKALDAQGTIVKNLGATYAVLTAKAKSYGLSAAKAGDLGAKLTQGLLKTGEEDYLSFKSGEQLIQQLLSDPTLQKKLQDELTKAGAGENAVQLELMMEDIRKGGARGEHFSVISDIVAQTTTGIESRLRATHKLLETVNDAALRSRLIEPVLKTPGLSREQQLAAARMFQAGANFEEGMAEFKSLVSQANTEQAPGSEIRESGENAVAAAVRAINPLTALQNIIEIGENQVTQLLGIQATLTIMAGLDIGKFWMNMKGGVKLPFSKTPSPAASRYAKFADDALEAEQAAAKAARTAKLTEGLGKAADVAGDVAKAGKAGGMGATIANAVKGGLSKVGDATKLGGLGGMLGTAGKVAGKLAGPLGALFAAKDVYEAATDESLDTTTRVTRAGGKAIEAGLMFTPAALPLLARNMISYGAGKIIGAEAEEFIDKYISAEGVLRGGAALLGLGDDDKKKEDTKAPGQEEKEAEEAPEASPLVTAVTALRDKADATNTWLKLIENNTAKFATVNESTLQQLMADNAAKFATVKAMLEPTQAFAPAVPVVAPNMSTMPSQTQAQPTMSQLAPPGSVPAIVSSRGFVLDPSGGATVDFKLSIPNFTNTIVQVNADTIESSKQTGG